MIGWRRRPEAERFQKRRRRAEVGHEMRDMIEAKRSRRGFLPLCDGQGEVPGEKGCGDGGMCGGSL
jgi:hypothetical protein